MATRRKRLAEQIDRTVKKFNKEMMAAHAMGLEVQIVMDSKKVGFPVISVRLLKEI
jgi:hypothetical protein